MWAIWHTSNTSDDDEEEGEEEEERVGGVVVLGGGGGGGRTGKCSNCHTENPIFFLHNAFQFITFYHCRCECNAVMTASVDLGP